MNKRLFLTGEVDEKMVDKAIDFMEELQSDPAAYAQKLDIYIGSDGGTLRDALTIVQYIELNELEPTTIGIGRVLSSALWIFMTGRRRILHRDCVIMQHAAGFTGAASTTPDLESDLHSLVQTTDRLHETMHSKCHKLPYGWGKNHVSDWITAQKALEWGICTEIQG